MPTFLPAITDELKQWALEQPMFWTASAPTRGKHVNISPKGLASATFTIFGPNQCAYLDQAGSGIETISHIYENSRVTLCWCSFDSMCRIMRFYCTGTVVEAADPRFDELVARMGQTSETVPGIRAVLLFDVWKVSTSCGFGVPLLEPLPPHECDDKGSVVQHFKDRQTLNKMLRLAAKKGKFEEFRDQYGGRSLDGVAGLRTSRRNNGESLLLSDLKLKIEKTVGDTQALMVGIVIGVLLMMVLRSQDFYAHMAPAPGLLDRAL